MKTNQIIVFLGCSFWLYVSARCAPERGVGKITGIYSHSPKSAVFIETDGNEIALF